MQLTSDLILRAILPPPSRLCQFTAAKSLQDNSHGQLVTGSNLPHGQLAKISQRGSQMVGKEAGGQSTEWQWLLRVSYVHIPSLS